MAVGWKRKNIPPPSEVTGHFVNGWEFLYCHRILAKSISTNIGKIEIQEQTQTQTIVCQYFSQIVEKKGRGELSRAWK